MKKNRNLPVFIAVLLLVSMACMCTTTTPDTPPTVTPPTKAPAQPQPPSNNGNPPANPPSNNGGSSDLVTFTDENNYLEFDIPGDWLYEQYTEEDLYIDIITAPDETAKIESLVFDNRGNLVNNGGAALYLLNYRYSNTGKEGDIRVSEDQIEPDGSERLEWKSKSGDYSGVSWFELRGDDKSIFLMFTMYWINDVDDATFQTIQAVADSYRVP